MSKPGKQAPKKEQAPIQKPAAQPVAKAAAKEPVSTIDLFDKFGNKAWLIALGLIFLIAFIVFKDYLLFDKVYQFKDIGSDTLNGLFPYMYRTAADMGAHGIPVWSYNWGMGQNIFPIIFRDPFDIFLFLAGKDHVAYGIVYKELAKILLGGVLFFFYLRTLRLSNYTSVAGSLLFSFCAFMIVGSGWNYFSFEAFSMALLLLGFELMFTRNKWYLFPLAIFIIAISTPVNLYIYGLFIAGYAVIRCFQAGEGDLKGIGGIFLKMAGFGLIGVLASAPLVIPNILMMLESPRGTGGSSYAHILSAQPMFDVADRLNFGTCMMRFFSSDMLGTGNEFRGWQNTLEAPMFYCGIACLLLLPQVFQFLSKRMKIVFGIFLGIWLLPIVFPYFRYAFWLFTGDYYRAYSFFVSMVFLYYSLIALEHIVKERKINLIVLIATVVLLFIVLNYPYFPEREAINQPVFAFASLLIVVYGALLYFMARPNTPVYLRYIFLGVVAFEAMYFSGISVNQRDAITAAELSQKVGYNDYSVEAVDFIKKNDKSFYRIDKNYASSPAMHASLNDALVFGYYGTSSYNSFNQGNYIAYLQMMGLVDKKDELQTRWALGLVSRPILESINDVKYILARKNMNPLWKIVCDSLATFGDVTVFRNKYRVPMGFTYNRYIKKSVFDMLSHTQKDFVSLAACVVEDADVSRVGSMKEFPLSDTIAERAFTFDIYGARVNELAKDTLTNPSFGTKVISGKINVSEDKVMYLAIPFDAGWTLKDNGQVVEKMKLSDGLTGIPLKKGDHAIELTYSQRYASAALGMLIAALLMYGAMFFLVKKKPIAKEEASVE